MIVIFVILAWAIALLVVQQMEGTGKDRNITNSSGPKEKEDSREE